MKIILNVLITIGCIVCEVPPPYQSRGFRPNPPFNLPLQSNFNPRPQPQTTYGVPPNPSKLALPLSPQVQYGTPNTPNVEPLGIRSNSASNVSPSFNSKPTIPSTSYGVPVTDSSRLQQNNIRILNSQPQTTYGAPSNVNNNVNRPQTQYGAPDTKNVENFEQIRQLNLLLQLRQSSTSASQSQNPNSNIIPTEQYLPVRDAANFRDNFSQSKYSYRTIQEPIEQYLPAREADNFKNAPHLSEVNIPQRQIQSTPGNNFGLSPNRPSTSFQPNPRNVGNPTLQYQPSQSHIPQRQIQISPGNDFGLSENKPDSSLQANNKNIGIPTSQYQPSQHNSAASLPQQYVPTIPSSNFQPAESNSNNFGASNQNTPQNFNQRPPININAIIPQFSNGHENNFGGANAQGNFDIQQADVRALSLPQGNRNNNAVPTQTQFAEANLSPKGRNENFGRPNLQGAERESVDEKYLPPTSTARTIHRQLNTPSVASVPTEAPVQQDEQSPESNEEAAGPNISIANAVAGVPGRQSFYLLQPDGRLQRVTYQKTREEGNQENEYTANYLFQNIQADPALVYSPLITLGK